MANTTLTQTGAQVQAILDKADKLPSTLGTAGQVLTMNAGATAPEWQTPSGGGSGHTLTLTNSGGGWCVIYYADGTYNTGVAPTGVYSNVIAVSDVAGSSLMFTGGIVTSNLGLLVDGDAQSGWLLLTDCAVTCVGGGN